MMLRHLCVDAFILDHRLKQGSLNLACYRPMAFFFVPEFRFREVANNCAQDEGGGWCEIASLRSKASAAIARCGSKGRYPNTHAAVWERLAYQYLCGESATLILGTWQKKYLTVWSMMLLMMVAGSAEKTHHLGYLAYYSGNNEGLITNIRTIWFK